MGTTGEMNFAVDGPERPRYHANDTSRDRLFLEAQTVDVGDARQLADAPTLDRHGFQILPCPGVDVDNHERCSAQTADLLRSLTGADRIHIVGPGIKRFSEASGRAGSLDNSRPARFVHVDMSEAAALNMVKAGGESGTSHSRFAYLNIWRVLTPPPQDVPLAVCDARTVEEADVVYADAVFDAPDKPEWVMEGILLKHAQRQKWWYFSGMTPDEALVFKTYDSREDVARRTPHSAFNDALGARAPTPRASFEMRAVAFWN